MAFTLYGGRATWDLAGVMRPDTLDHDNLAPLVNAGPDQRVLLSSGALLSGWSIDDGRPAGASLTYAWSKISGPGTVTFGNAANASDDRLLQYEWPISPAPGRQRQPVDRV